MKDMQGKEIHVGDVLQSMHGYAVIVAVDASGELYGQLLCDEHNTCKGIPYALNGGRGYLVVTGKQHDDQQH